MKILMLSAEAAPFAMVGNVAEVSAALAKAVHALGHDVRLCLPRYACINPRRFGLKTIIDHLSVPHAETTLETRIMEAVLDGDIPVYFVECESLFGREGVYGYQDDGERFVCWCRAALEMVKHLNWKPDIIHCHDWQTGIVPNWLRTIYRDDAFFAGTATVFTIHDLQYQGVFGWHVLQVAGVAQHHFICHPQIADLDNVVDLTARGIIFTDAITTLSEHYAQQIMTAEFGEKLDPLLRERRDRVWGILSGVDQDVNDPARDPAIAVNYDSTSLSWRSENKASLQRVANLRVDVQAPVVGMIAPLVRERGLDLMAETIDPLMDLGIQLVVLGTGDINYHEVLTRVERTYPQRAHIFLTSDAKMARRIYAGVDVFLAPCRVQPGSVDHLAAMRYGAVPAVHATGSLADSVTDWTPARGAGNGFVFTRYDRWALFACLARALETYRYDDVWQTIQRTNMSQDYSWTRSAEKYVDVYGKAATTRKKARP